MDRHVCGQQEEARQQRVPSERPQRRSQWSEQKPIKLHSSTSHILGSWQSTFPSAAYLCPIHSAQPTASRDLRVGRQPGGKDVKSQLCCRIVASLEHKRIKKQQPGVNLLNVSTVWIRLECPEAEGQQVTAGPCVKMMCGQTRKNGAQPRVKGRKGSQDEKMA